MFGRDKGGIDPVTLDDRRGEMVVLDVRDPHEWQAGHIDGAVHVPVVRARRQGRHDRPGTAGGRDLPQREPEPFGGEVPEGERRRRAQRVGRYGGMGPAPAADRDGPGPPRDCGLMRLKQFHLENLGHASYLVGDEASGEALILDPQRDVRAYLEAARARGLRIAYRDRHPRPQRLPLGDLGGRERGARRDGAGARRPGSTATTIDRCATARSSRWATSGSRCSTRRGTRPST